MSVSRCECGRRLQTERGLKIHQAKPNMKGTWRNSVLMHSGKTQNDTGPESCHSSESVRVSGLMEDPPRARIKFPRGNERCAVWLLK